MTLEHFLLLLLIILVLLLDLFIFLLDSYTIVRFVVVLTYILIIFCIIMKNSLFLWHLSISNCYCLLFILFYLKLIHSCTSIWSNIILVNILVNILIVLLVVYILYYLFTVNFSKSYFFCDTWAFFTLVVNYSCSLTWFIHILVRFIFYCSLCCCYYLYSYYYLYNYEKLTFFVTLEYFLLLLFIVYTFLLKTDSFLYFCLISYHSRKHFC